MSAVISGEYVTFKHVKTRKVVVLEVEIAEERFAEVLEKLGMPIGGESKPVAIALLQKEVVADLPDNPINYDKKNYVVKAVMLCKNLIFQDYVVAKTGFLTTTGEEAACIYIKHYCGIESRSALKTDKIAQNNLDELSRQFEAWKLEQSYKDNIVRM